MVIGFIGSGSMAAALARGLAGQVDGMLFSDSGSGRAAALAEELGGEALSSEEVARRADALILAVKPAALDSVAPSLQEASEIVSVLAATPLARLREAFPEATVLRTMPNVGVEVRKGVICVAGDDPSPAVAAALEYIAHVVAADDPHGLALDFCRSVFAHACMTCGWDADLAASAEGTPPPVA